MLDKELPCLLLVVATHQLAEERINVFFLLLVEFLIVVDQHGSQYANQNQHGNEAAKMVERGNCEAHDEGGAGCDKPSADNRDHASESVNGCFAPPCAVGQT